MPDCPAKVWVLMWDAGDGDAADIFASESGAKAELGRREKREHHRSQTQGPYYTRGAGYIYEADVHADAS
jgi:hypothetical protein